MAAAYKTIPLFGGAITTSLPIDFADVSNIRQIPSNQEIYLHTTGLSSIIIEILEYACPPDHPCSTDDDALKFHYADIVVAGNVRAEFSETTRFWAAGDVHIAHLAGAKGVKALGIIGTQTPAEGALQGDVDFTALLVTLVRLKEQKADLLITVNVPHAKGEYDVGQINLEKAQWGDLISKGMQIRDAVWKSLDIRDWTLFDG